ncbi:MAG: DivIVA domain-containing protein [Bacilli bacterium]|nr:DivIVA domain-containing protein [Bacilli bacterium]
MKKFNNSLMGYDKAEVNAFVNEVTTEFENILDKLKQKDADILALKKELTKYENLESTLNKTILAAEEVSNNMRNVARSESKSILDEARKNASRILNDALMKAEKAQSDADMLKRRIINFKRRFRQAVENELDVIDSLDENY